MIARIFAAAAALGLSAMPVSAQANALDRMVGMISTQTKRTTENGQLVGCWLAFKAIYKDEVRRLGEYGSVVGTFELRSDERGGAIFILKGTVFDMAFVGRDVDFVPNTPAKIDITTASGRSTAGIASASVPSEEPGTRQEGFALSADVAAIVDELIEGERGTFLFNHGGPGTETRVPLDFTVVDTKDNGRRITSRDELVKYRECSAEFLGGIARN